MSHASATAGFKDSPSNQPFPSSMVLTPVSRNPIQLQAETIKAVMNGSIRARPSPVSVKTSGRPNTGRHTSIVVVTFNNLVFNRICLESVLANSGPEDYELL